ncbi:hypothetical protein BDW74DRAFT_151211 [Aspergillus multicolor]|uniref:uncharacterized protein n=1 Tax=Aspergillus multicolor TaxID=41759 RepID=UPI003CCCDEA6
MLTVAAVMQRQQTSLICAPRKVPGAGPPSIPPREASGQRMQGLKTFLTFKK